VAQDDELGDGVGVPHEVEHLAGELDIPHAIGASGVDAVDADIVIIGASGAALPRHNRTRHGAHTTLGCVDGQEATESEVKGDTSAHALPSQGREGC